MANEDGKEDIQHKIYEICELKTEKTDDGAYLTGRANTIGKEDRYGDIPTRFNDKNIYELKMYKKNPVVLADHINSIGKIAGSMVRIKEDETGLMFKMKFMENPIDPTVAHGIEAFKEGHGRALSIGGRWLFEDPDNPLHLTKAIIHEISLVGVGADAHALTDTPKPKKIPEGTQGNSRAALERLVKEFRTTGDVSLIPKIDKTIEELKR